LIEHDTTGTSSGHAGSPHWEPVADVPLTYSENQTEIPTVVRTKENALGDAATDGVVGTKSDDEGDKRQHVQGCNPGQPFDRIKTQNPPILPNIRTH
jgi:hypothetical protein